MTVELLVPTLGESVVEATVAKWMKSPGESINSDEPLVELETEKVTLEVASKGLSVAQFFVGVSKTESLPSPAVTERLFDVQSFPLLLLSVPSAAVLELSE